MEGVGISPATFCFFLPLFGALMFHPWTDASSSSVTRRPCGMGSLGWTAAKWAEVLRHPAFSGIPKQRGTKSELATSPLPSRGPNRARKCYITPAFSGIPKQRETKLELAASPLPSRGPKRGRRRCVTPTLVFPRHKGPYLSISGTLRPGGFRLGLTQ